MTCSRGHLRLVQSLLEAGANPNIADRWGRTALHCASAAGHVEAVRLLLNAGCDTRAEDNKGDSALHSACRLGHLEVVSAAIREIQAFI